MAAREVEFDDGQQMPEFQNVIIVLVEVDHAAVDVVEQAALEAVESILGCGGVNPSKHLILIVFVFGFPDAVEQFDVFALLLRIDFLNKEFEGPRLFLGQQLYCFLQWIHFEDVTIFALI